VARAMGAKPWGFHGITARLEAFTLPRAAGVICLNGYTRQQVGQLARRKWTIPNAVGFDFFNVERRAETIPRLLCPAFVCNYKNQNALIRSLDHVAKEQQFTLSFAGAVSTNEYGAEFQELIAARPWCE